MRIPKSVGSAEDSGGMRLSRTFFMRDFRDSEIVNIRRMTNLPDDPDFAIMAWSVHNHLQYSEPQFFPKLAAFNISGHEWPRGRITSFAAP